MTRLLALVADLLAVGRFLGAVARVVAVLATVVALAALETVTYSYVSHALDAVVAPVGSLRDM